ncbi:MAG: hypothetical protein P4L85_14635 [Paludisphaera borealis]|uniref:hypothetical protein n=1 Tax=Paludisphaera borealis TaxID=1387353 RepID=UPI00284ACECA|nr:hypothetical protein [Paludisphaera borealis]MDR3620585.1 hypothetical protein [Paludisphaera borealis]
MRWVLACSLFCGQIAWLVAGLRDWEARRGQMYHQQDVTKAIMEEWKTALGLIEVAGPMFDDPRRTPTSEWSENILAVGADGWRPTTRRMRASGSISHFSLFCIFRGTRLEPITVEIFDPLFLDGPWLERLLRDYDERGWRYKVVMPSDAGLASAPPFRSPF